MKKILFLVTCLAAAAALGSCNKRATATPGGAAKHYVEQLQNDNYEAFIAGIAFVKPVEVVAPAARESSECSCAESLRAIHRPDVVERGGIREVRLVSEKVAPDHMTCDVTLTNHYLNGDIETIDFTMVNEVDVWKVRENPYKEIWHATDNNGNIEVIKVRTGHERDFFKGHDDGGEREFVKNILRHNGQKEIVKVLENGTRHREVIEN
ncbi:MAG: hypothetical protein LBV38_07785 [Alistipes sp.]|jgi:hypothetical protein|nr:hypothetical protein [Alistipes sp.]